MSAITNNNINTPEKTPPASPARSTSMSSTMTNFLEVIEKVEQQISPTGNKRLLSSPDEPESKRVKLNSADELETPEASPPGKRSYPDSPTDMIQQLKKARVGEDDDNNDLPPANTTGVYSTITEEPPADIYMSHLAAMTHSTSLLTLHPTPPVIKKEEEPKKYSFSIFSDENRSAEVSDNEGESIETFMKLTLPEKTSYTLEDCFSARLKQVTHLNGHIIKVGDQTLEIGHRVRLGSKLVTYKIVNKNLVIKLLNSKVLNSAKNSAKKYVDITVANYNKALQLRIPVAKIYNINTLEKDYCILQERMRWPLNMNNEREVLEAKQLLLTVFANKVNLEIHPRNLRVDVYGNVVVVDVGGYRGSFADHIMNEWAKSFAQLDTDHPRTREETSALLYKFTNGFEKYYKISHNEILLDMLFPKKPKPSLAKFR